MEFEPKQYIANNTSGRDKAWRTPVLQKSTDGRHAVSSYKCPPPVAPVCRLIDLRRHGKIEIILRFMPLFPIGCASACKRSRVSVRTEPWGCWDWVEARDGTSASRAASQRPFNNSNALKPIRTYVRPNCTRVSLPHIHHAISGLSGRWMHKNHASVTSDSDGIQGAVSYAGLKKYWHRECMHLFVCLCVLCSALLTNADGLQIRYKRRAFA